MKIIKVLSILIIACTCSFTVNPQNRASDFAKKQGKDFRFFNNKKYLIADSGKVYIYTTTTTESGTNKSSKQITNFFFSTSANSKIIPLTIANLKRTYPGNPKLQDLMDIHFKNDADLTAYNEHRKTFEINHFLFQHLK